jgi:polyferredoxin
MRALRTIIQTLFLAGVVALLVRGLAGLTANTCETYCPFGGLVAVPPLITHRAYSCTLSELNVALLVSLVILTLATKKSFCSWICPLGTVQEWIGRGGRKTFGRYLHLPAAADRWLMLLRYGVLGGVLVLTYTVWGNIWGEGPLGYDLGFRAYDPYYILFTWGGHGTTAVSLAVVIGVLAAAFVVPFFWCRYLCPLGATMDPLSRAGALRIRRDPKTCTDCGRCDDACPHAIPLSSVGEVTARNCTNCLDCVAACPAGGALELSWFGK